MPMKDALDTALAMEIEGKRIYESVARETKNDVVRKVFEYLASEEVKHISKIREFSNGKVTDAKKGLTKDALMDAKKRLHHILEPLRKDIHPDLTDEGAYQKAMELERRGHDFYQNQSEVLTEREVREFFEILASQENAHYELLERSLKFLQHPSQWYENEEGWFL